MHRILSKDEKRFVCEMVRDELASGKSLPSIFKGIYDTMGIRKSEIYGWNKSFNMIFKNNLISVEDRILMCEIVYERLLFGMNIGAAVESVAKHFNLERHVIYKWNRKLNIFDTRDPFDEEEKIATCKRIEADRLVGGEVADSVKNNALRLGVSLHTIYDWNRKFKIFKTRDYSKRGTMFSDEFISSVLKDVISVGGGEKNIRKIAEKYSISLSTVYTWRRSKMNLLKDNQR